MPVLNTGNIQLNYQRVGSGSPLLMVAGMASDSASWQPVIAPLSEHFELIIVDNRCAGQTLPTPVDVSRGLMVGDLCALINALSLEKVHLLGHSMGAMQCWALAAAIPNKIQALVAASAPPQVDQVRIDLFQTLARLRTNDNERDWFKLLFHFLFSSEFFADAQRVDDAASAALAYPHTQSIAAFTAQCNALPSFLEPLDLSGIHFPCLTLTGQNDKLFSPEMMRQSYTSMPHVEQQVIDNAAHSVHWENPADFASCVLAFLKK